jgi:CelD/BcsL family acetyltransferase involved in cellulose biosynthesis
MFLPPFFCPGAVGSSGSSRSLCSLRCLRLTSDSQWDSIVQSLGDGSFFHTSAWARVLTDTYHYSPCSFVVFQDEIPVAALPLMEVDSLLTGRRGVSLPFSDFCDSLSVSPEAASRALDAALDHGRARRWRYLELRKTANLVSDATASARYYRHILPIQPPFARLFDGFDPSVRRAIRKAQRAGVVTEMSHELDAVRAFYRLHCATRRRHGVPPQPFRFFERLHEHALKAGHGFVVLARWQGNPVAAAVFGHAGRSALYKFGASDPRFQEVRGNNVVMSRAIQWCADNGMESLDFGRTETGNDGLRRFKLGWGAQESEIQYSRYDPAQNRMLEGLKETREPGSKICRHLPLPILRLAGKMLYRHMG